MSGTEVEVDLPPVTARESLPWAAWAIFGLFTFTTAMKLVLIGPAWTLQPAVPLAMRLLAALVFAAGGVFVVGSILTGRAWGVFVVAFVYVFVVLPAWAGTDEVRATYEWPWVVTVEAFVTVGLNIVIIRTAWWRRRRKDHQLIGQAKLLLALMGLLLLLR